MRTRIFVTITVLMALVFFAGLVVGRAQGVPEAPSKTDAAAPASFTPDRFEAPASELTDGERRDIDIFNKASRSTVYISEVSVRRNLFSLDSTRIERGSGTGFVWDTKGHVVTNFHVVRSQDRSSEYIVTLWDQSEWEAEIVGRAPGKDLAVLRIDASEELLAPLTIGTSADLAVGQKVLALGNPFGLDQTLTTGIVSALGRDMQSPDGRTIHDVVQTDAAINPGNSGGPLLDSSGRLIGVNTAIISPSGGYAGIGFAIPVDTVRRLIPQLIQYGEPIRPGIGVAVLNDYAARRYGFKGVVITDVSRGMPAERAGLEAVRIDRRGHWSGDVIVGVNGDRVRNLAELQDAFEDAGGAGTAVRLTLFDGRGEREVEVSLIEINR